MFLPVFGLEFHAGQTLQHRQNHKDVSGVPQRGTALFSLFMVFLLFLSSLLLFSSLRSGFSSWQRSATSARVERRGQEKIFVGGESVGGAEPPAR